MKAIILQLRVELDKKDKEDMEADLSKKTGCNIVLLPPSIDLTSLKIID